MGGCAVGRSRIEEIDFRCLAICFAYSLLPIGQAGSSAYSTVLFTYDTPKNLYDIPSHSILLSLNSPFLPLSGPNFPSIAARSPSHIALTTTLTSHWIGAGR